MAQITLNHYCKSCGICAAFCPKNVFDYKPNSRPVPTRPEDCILCRQCTARCPDFAITVEGDGK